MTRADESGVTQKGDLVIVKNEWGNPVEIDADSYKNFTATVDNDVLYLQSNDKPTIRAHSLFFLFAKNARECAEKLNHILTYRRGVKTDEK